MKPNRPCFSVTQSSDAWEVFRKRAEEKSTTIEECHSFDNYKWSKKVLEQIRTYGEHQKLNIALALQLAKTWLREIKFIGEN
jgi:folylpolyglutamate synthase/dihydropteroate synthase